MITKNCICSAPDRGSYVKGRIFVIPDRLLSPSMATNTVATATPILHKDSGE
ncbi:MAG: hypothetical protein R6V21_11640 [Pelovirga sp.]